MNEKLKSRKLWVAVLGAALMAAGKELGLEQATVEDMVQLLMAYLVAQGAHDAAKAWGQPAE